MAHLPAALHKGRVCGWVRHYDANAKGGRAGGAAQGRSQGSTPTAKVKGEQTQPSLIYNLKKKTTFLKKKFIYKNFKLTLNAYFSNP